MKNKTDKIDVNKKIEAIRKHRKVNFKFFSRNMTHCFVYCVLLYTKAGIIQTLYRDYIDWLSSSGKAFLAFIDENFKIVI